MTSKERCLAVLQNHIPDHIPFFPLLMFLAADRLGVDYTTYITDASALAEAQINLFENYRVDAVTTCSDSYLLAADLGAEVVFAGNQTPHLARPLATCESDIINLGNPDMDAPTSRCRQRIDAVNKIHRSIGDTCFVCGWVEMPFAEVCEWFGVQDFMYLLFDEPEVAHLALNKAADYEIEFALRQLEAGADMIGCGDAASSLIGHDFFKEFALPYEQKVLAAIKKAGGYSKLHICGDTTHNFDLMAQSGPDLINIDYAVDLHHAAEVFCQAGYAIKGNADPVRDILNATPEEACACARKMIEDTRGCRYMLSPGCEMPAATPDENLLAFASACQVDQF